MTVKIQPDTSGARRLIAVALESGGEPLDRISSVGTHFLFSLLALLTRK